MHRQTVLLHGEVLIAKHFMVCVLFQARKIEEHQRKYERLRAEKEIRERQRRVRKAREEQAKAASANKSKQPDLGAAGMGGLGGMGGGKGDFKIPTELMDIFNDPEVQKCFEVS